MLMLLGVTGAAEFDSSVTVDGTATFNGSTVIGNNNADTVIASALLSQVPIIPDTTTTYSLGNTNNKFSIVYASQFQGDVTGDVTGNVQEVPVVQEL